MLPCLSTYFPRQFPGLDGTVFDQPHVVAELHGSQKLKYVGGNIFEAIPSAHAVLLKLRIYIYINIDINITYIYTYIYVYVYVSVCGFVHEKYKLLACFNISIV